MGNHEEGNEMQRGEEGRGEGRESNRQHHWPLGICCAAEVDGARTTRNLDGIFRAGRTP